MKSIIRIFGVAFVAAVIGISITACSDDSGESSGADCKEVSVNDSDYCVKRRQEIRETGFSCPQRLPNRHRLGDLVVCSKNEQISEQDKRHLQREYGDEDMAQDVSEGDDRDTDETTDNTGDVSDVGDMAEDDTGQEETSEMSGCRTDSDCRETPDCNPGSDPNCQFCIAVDEAHCGIGCRVQNECSTDSECNGDRICAEATPNVVSCCDEDNSQNLDGVKICRLSCEEIGCRAFKACKSDGVCERRTCSDTSECEHPMAECSGGSCNRQGCQTDSDCPTDGYCVKGECYQQLGQCRGPAP